jgi:hypothetical protein
MAADYYKQHGVINNKEAVRLRNLALAQGTDVVLFDPVQDEVWARTSLANQNRSSDYFDYFFTGQDVRVHVAEIPENDKKFGHLPIAQIGYNVEQEKQPIYGFWDYTHTAVMRGTRIISGAFSIYTKYPNYMMDVLSVAAANRANKTLIDTYGYPQPLTEDDKLIEQYWGRSLFDPGITAQGGKHIFSSHPPFSLVLNFGLQPMSVPLEGSYEEYKNWYVKQYGDGQNSTFTDMNHRLVNPDPSVYENRIVLDGIELKSMQMAVGPEGQAITETYSFFARDIIVPTIPNEAKLVAPTAGLPSTPSIGGTTLNATGPAKPTDVL